MSPKKRTVPPALHPLEAEVRQQLWHLGEANVRSVTDTLNEHHKHRAYTTIMTTMARLYEKGLLKRRREKKTDFYSPALSRAEYQEARAQGQVGALVEEFGDLALVHFARQMDSLDPKRREQLRRLARRG